jgi:predicted porin
MKRNLIALAVSAAVVAPTMAMAEGEVKVYGRAQVEIASFSKDDNNDDVNKKADGISVVDNAMGRVGVMATEDLGGGLKGLAKFEFKLDTADGDSSGSISLTKRELFVGLKGSNWGQLELGRLKSEYKYKGGVKYDPFVATTLEARGNGGMTGNEFNGAADYINDAVGDDVASGISAYGHNSFLSNQIGYRSPKFGGFSFGATYGPEEEDGAYTIGAKFEMPMFEIIAAAVGSGDALSNFGGGGPAPAGGSAPARQEDSTQEYSAAKFGGQVKLAGAHKISLQYEMSTVDLDIDGAGNAADTVSGDWDTLFLGYQGTFGKATFVAQYGQQEASGDLWKDDADAEPDTNTYMALGAIYKFSKLTRVFGGYRVTDRQVLKTNTDGDDVWTDDGGESVISIGLRKDFK